MRAHWQLRAAGVLHSIVGMALLIMGSIYLFSPRFMPYHSVALQLRWEDLDSNAKGMILGYLRLGAAGFLTTGISVLVLTWIALRKRVGWVWWLVVSMSFVYLTILHVAVWTVMKRTPASPPIAGIYLLATLSATGAVFAHLGSRTTRIVIRQKSSNGDQ